MHKMNHVLMCIHYLALVLFDQSTCIVLFWYLCHMLPVEIWEHSWNPVDFLLTENIKRGQSRDNYAILLFNSKYQSRWIDVIFLQDTTCVCLFIKFMCIQRKLGNARITVPLSKFLSLIHMNFIFKDIALIVSLSFTRKLGVSRAYIQQ